MGAAPRFHAPPLDEWSSEGAELALARFTADLGRVDADIAFNRLLRLTEEQRTWVLEQIDSWLPTDQELEPD